MITKYIPIMGTDSWCDKATGCHWWEVGSHFDNLLRLSGIEQLCPTLPFHWSTDLAGLFGRVRAWVGFTSTAHSDWKAGGKALQYYLAYPHCEVAEKDRNIIAHSHGLQVVLYAASYGMKVNNLISVGSPVRKDMVNIVKLARPNIKFWLHISDTKWDTWSFAGTLTDTWLLHKDLRHPAADVNDQVPGIGHSKILYDPSFYHLWVDNGWLERLKYGYGNND